MARLYSLSLNLQLGDEPEIEYSNKQETMVRLATPLIFNYRVIRTSNAERLPVTSVDGLS
jgi:hypothetical protein